MTLNEERDYDEEPEKEELSATEAFEVLLKHVGGGGMFQWRVFIITSLSGLFFSFNSVSAVFLAASPDYECDVHEKDSVLKNNSFASNVSDFEGEWMNKCQYLEFSSLIKSLEIEGDNISPHNLLTKDCPSWIYDDSIYKSTVVTEWDLVCDKTWLMSLVQASYMGGVLTGSLTFSQLSDMYGRRRVSLIASVGFIISSIATTFSWNFLTFIILRFISACCVSGIFITNFVIGMEFCGQEARTLMGIFYQTFSGISLCILPLIAYFLRDWRYLQLAISVPSVLLLIYFKILPESPRWLFSKGREEDAMIIIKNIAVVNRKKLPIKEELENLLLKVNRPPNVLKTCFGKLTNFFRSQALLLRTTNLRRRSLIIYYSWFVVSMVYYGITFNGANINASVYLMVFFGGLAEVLSYIFASLTLKRYGRRLNISLCYIICGISCMLILAVPKEMVWLNLTLSTIGKFFNTIAFAIAYIFSAELVPTKVRNVAVGTSSMCARIGSISAPFIVDLLGQIHYTIPSTIFGILSILAGFLDLLLPETGNRPLPETIEEVEAMER